MLGKIEGRRRRGWQGKRWLDRMTDSVDMSLSKLQVSHIVGGFFTIWATREASHEVQHDWAAKHTAYAVRKVCCSYFSKPRYLSVLSVICSTFNTAPYLIKLSSFLTSYKSLNCLVIIFFFQYDCIFIFFSREITKISCYNSCILGF